MQGGQNKHRITIVCQIKSNLSKLVWYDEFFIVVVKALDNMSRLPDDVVVIKTIKERHWHCSTSNWLRSNWGACVTFISRNVNLHYIALYTISNTLVTYTNVPQWLVTVHEIIYVCQITALTASLFHSWQILIIFDCLIPQECLHGLGLRLGLLDSMVFDFSSYLLCCFFQVWFCVED